MEKERGIEGWDDGGGQVETCSPSFRKRPFRVQREKLPKHLEMEPVCTGGESRAHTGSFCPKSLDISSNKKAIMSRHGFTWF